MSDAPRVWPGGSVAKGTGGSVAKGTVPERGNLGQGAQWSLQGVSLREAWIVAGDVRGGWGTRGDDPRGRGSGNLWEPA